jgi:protein TonB
MDTSNQSIESFNELVFENRNKEYGAYVIRKSYNDNLSIALFSTLSIFGLIALLSFLFSKNIVKAPDITVQIAPRLVSIPVVITPLPKPEEPKITKTTPPKTPELKTDILNAKVVDTKTDANLKPNEETKIVANGKIDGKDTVTPEPPVIHIVKAIAPPSEALPIVTEMPDFNGNLFQYIRDNISYPRIAAASGTSGTVVVQFVVETDGSIGNIKVLKPVEDGCTEEAVRVVKSMPKWKPGKNHGEPARVLFNLPIKFTIK